MDPTRSRRRRPFPVSLPLLVLLLAAGPAWSRGAEQLTELASFNGVYTDLDGGGLQPIRQGPLTIRVSSPSHRLVVHRNRLTMTPGPAGVFDAQIEVELEGEGELIAEVDAGVTSRFEDEVTVPRQTLTVAGQVRLAQADHGYSLTVVSLPAHVGLRLESNLARQLVGTCEMLAGILPLSCDSLGDARAEASIPLPRAGEVIAVDASRLAPDERAYFDALVRAAP